MITQLVTLSNFWQWLQSGSHENNFSYNGATALFEHIEELQDGTPDNYDPVSWCCSYS